MRLKSIHWLMMLVSEGSTGVGASPFKIILSHGCWRGASVPCLVRLSIGQLECPYNMAKRLVPARKEKAAVSFMEVTNYDFCNILFLEMSH